MAMHDLVELCLWPYMQKFFIIVMYISQFSNFLNDFPVVSQLLFIFSAMYFYLLLSSFSIISWLFCNPKLFFIYFSHNLLISINYNHCLSHASYFWTEPVVCGNTPYLKNHWGITLWSFAVVCRYHCQTFWHFNLI